MAFDEKLWKEAVPEWSEPSRGDSGGEPDMTNWCWYPVEGDERFCILVSIYDDPETAPDVMLYNPVFGYDDEPYFGEIADKTEPVELFDLGREIWQRFVEENADELELLF